MQYFILCFLSFLLISCGGDTATKDVEHTVQIPDSSPIVVDDFATALDEVSDKVKETPEFNACMQSTIIQCTQTSVMQVAQKSKSALFCEELENIDQKESCKFAVIMLSVQEAGDEKLCEDLSEKFQKNCVAQAYKIQVQRTKDITLCDRISPSGFIGSGSKNTGDMNERGQCIMNILLGNPRIKESECSKIGVTQLENICKTSIRQRTPIAPKPSSLTGVINPATGAKLK